MHNAAFAAAGIDGQYELMEIDEDDVPGVVAEARAGDNWLGLGVTAPYKRLVASLVDEVEPEATLIGAVNNVVRARDGRLVGFNTDAPGFRAGAELALGAPLAGRDVVIAGAGGVAHAIAFACLQAGVRRLTIGNRSLVASIAGGTWIIIAGVVVEPPAALIEAIGRTSARISRLFGRPVAA